jgi:uncharacterized repeat protein (TIGR03803 family)
MTRLHSVKILSRFLLFTLAAVLGSNRTTAQTFTNLYNFTNIGVTAINGDPVAGLVVSGNILYGATYLDGTNSSGTIFALNTNGTGFATLHTFSRTVFSASAGGFTNSDGANPVGLILSGNMLYGTTSSGGTNGSGTVFALNTNGNGFVTLHTFNTSSFDVNVLSSTNSDGADPQAGLVSSGGTLYGTTYMAGTNGWGTVFALNTSGTGFTTLHSFNGGATASATPSSDGGNPAATLVLHGDTLYGTAEAGGTNGWGMVFALNTNGLGFITLHSFTPYTYNAETKTLTTNTDGAVPEAGLVLSGNMLYGTTSSGGTNGTGMVFAVDTNGPTTTTVYDFSVTNGTSFTNDDGANPLSVLVLSGNTLYGTTEFGGTKGNGTVFAVNTDGTGFATLYDFNPVVENGFAIPTNYGGANPKTGLVLSGNTLFGTANGGGSYNRQSGDGGGLYGGGTVFALTVSMSLSSIPLNLQLNAPNLVLTWTDPAFFLQTASGITGPWTTVPGATSPHNAPVTNPMQFFRLVYTNNP